MKKKLEAELISIAHRILQLKDKTTLSQLQEEARELYEKLTILNFSESHFAGPQPTIGQIKEALDTNEPDASDTSNESDELKKVRQKIKAIIDPKPISDKKEESIPEEFSSPKSDQEQKEASIDTIENKPEIIIEEINARVTEDLFVPASTKVAEESVSFSDSIPPQSTYEKNDKENITPTVEDISDANDRPKSLNDQLRKEIHIGLNDRLAFIKYLFGGSAPDYNRVLSQLNTLRGKSEAEEFITTMIKPDYQNWEGKEEYEERFMDIVLSKFDH
ncbi:hypothetical protein IWQ47_004880 [Aquimarina sp. EL_43]|uniref:hypothetical protein n=1 Tax=unclassified Aquimarina TaxID=2627091 RepID=UPI0018CBE716|nr:MULTISPECIES: hypothetical protein [unclassified Aquimarina]MBG6133470.1 hypothetical protein [Aquimarina sp. EL_35]MBG6153628.1 hypothetical protein [Aquimarina sp. EL_32]MBG6171784.1 hypothetical protein [Aquimarina sp. EL_43]